MPDVRVIYTERDREEIIQWIARARLGTRLTARGPVRTLPQNDKMWAMLTDIVRQRKKINGKEFSTAQWKAIFSQALGHEQEILPTLDGAGFFATDLSTSKMSEAEMSDLIEYIYAWGAENNVRWSDPNLLSQEEMMRR